MNHKKGRYNRPSTSNSSSIIIQIRWTPFFFKFPIAMVVMIMTTRLLTFHSRPIMAVRRVVTVDVPVRQHRERYTFSSCYCCGFVAPPNRNYMSDYPRSKFSSYPHRTAIRTRGMTSISATNILISLGPPNHPPPPLSPSPQRRIRIMGGGLAGLSTAYHLLSLLSSSSSSSSVVVQPPNTTVLDITIYDTEQQIGTGGASAIAGGYVSFIYFCWSLDSSPLFCTIVSLVLLLFFRWHFRCFLVNDDYIYLLLLIWT